MYACIYLFIYNFAKMPGFNTYRASSIMRSRKKENNNNSNSSNNYYIEVQTSWKQPITNSIGANVDEGINNTFDKASWSMAD